MGWTVVVVCAAAVVGASAGAVARLLLAGLSRGAVVPAPVCEVAVALVWAVVGLGWALGPVPGGWLPVLLGLGWLGVAVAAVDLRHRRIPDALTLPALPIAVLCTLPVGAGAPLRALVGAAVAVAGHAVVHVVARGALGAGDVKLAAPLGAVLAAAAWPAVPVAALLAALLTAAVATAGLATGLLGRGSAVPHGPSMVLGSAGALAWLALGPTGLPPPG